MAKTINAANIAIGYDGSKLKAGTDMARADLAKLKSILKETADPAKVLAYEEGLLTKALDAGVISKETAARAMRKLKDDYARATSAAKEHASATKTVSDSVKNLAVAAAGVLTLRAAYQQLAESVSLAAKQEKTTAVFGAMLGSGSQGRQMINELKELTKSGVAFSTSSQVAQTMLAFGVAADEVLPSIERIAMITGADAERMKMLGLAFSQSAAAGRLVGQDLLQMVNAGFNPLQEISQQTGVSLLELKKRMEEGAISTNLVKMAFESATGEAGKFKDVLDAQKNTFSGQYNQMLADLEKMKTSIGQDLLPLMRDMVTMTRELTGGSDNRSEGVDKSFISRTAYGARAFMAVYRERVLGDPKMLADLEGGTARRITADYEAFEMERQRRNKSKGKDEKKNKEMLDELNRTKNAEERKAMYKAMEQAQMDKIYEKLEREAAIREKLKDSAKAIIDAQQSPLEKLKAELTEIQKLVDAGMLNEQQAKRAGLDAMRKNDGGSGSNYARRVTAGTDEAYRLMTGSLDERLATEEEVLSLNKLQLDVQKEIAKNTKSGGVTVIK